MLSDCALLPRRVELRKVKRRIPRNTRESIAQGMREGFPAMINALVKKYQRLLKLSPRAIPVITGGDAAVIQERLNFPHRYEPLLVIKGLALLGRTLNR